MIRKQWPIGFIRQLSKIVNLSNLNKVCLNFRDECYFATTLEVEMNVLYKHACNLRSIEIICDVSDRMMFITRKAIGMKLPQHIRELDIRVDDFEDAKRILNRNRHLSRIVFESTKHGKVLHKKIANYLKYMRRDFLCELVWNRHFCCDSCDEVKGVYLWLDNWH